MYFLNVASGISPSTPSVCVWALRWTFITCRASVCKHTRSTVTLNNNPRHARVQRRGRQPLYHVPLLVVLVFDDEDHIETRQNGGHEVDVVLPLCVVPAAVHGVSRCQHRAARVQGGGDASLGVGWGVHVLSLPSGHWEHSVFLIFIKKKPHLSDGDGLLLHGLVDRHPVILSHLKNKPGLVFNTEVWNCSASQLTTSFYLVKLIDADDSAVGQHHGSPLHDESSGAGVPQHRGGQTSCTAALPGGVDLMGTESKIRIGGADLHVISLSEANEVRITYPNRRAPLYELQQLGLGCPGITQHQQVDVAATSETVRQPGRQEIKALLNVRNI